MATIIGLDLAGPANVRDTALVRFIPRAKKLSLAERRINCSDQDILQVVQSISGDIIIGVDAPLSYQPGGGDRPGDYHLRHRLMEAGLPSGSVMVPTQTRMAFLTLRGISVVRMLTAVSPESIRVVEVHPGGAMALRKAPIEMIVNMKHSARARTQLLKWLTEQNLTDLPGDGNAVTDHEVAAWHWVYKEHVWLQPAEPPFHPFDFAC